MLIPLKIDNYLNKNFKNELKYLVLLSLISKLVNPKLILEIGTFTGY
ncbi:MAG: hypothetical protein P1T50_00045 [Candidatus Karelsulcia muelleri]|nr:MAG: hypothetical protein P1T50_00045 [Candidatus Karelsulcia muelleri]